MQSSTRGQRALQWAIWTVIYVYIKVCVYWIQYYAYKYVLFSQRYTIWTKVLGQLTITPTTTLYSNYTDIYMDLVPAFAAITASTLLGRLSTTFWSISVVIFSRLSSRAFVSSDTHVGREGLTRSLCSSSSQKCLMALRSGPVKFFLIKLIQPCPYGPGFLHWGIVMLE